MPRKSTRRAESEPLISQREQKRIGKRIQQQRKLQGLQQEKLAEMIGCDPTFLSGIENGSRSFSLGTLYLLAKSLGVTPGWILDGDETVASDPLSKQVRELLAGFNPQQRENIIVALQSLKKV